MRTVTSNAQEQLDQSHGNEPIIVIGIEWTEDGGVSYYAERDILDISGKILELSAFNTTLNVNSATTADCNFVLDDTDGTIKSAFNTADLHKRPVKIYQFYGDLSDLSDKFKIFQGEVSSPITWDEGARTISLTALSPIEDQEIGFSPEEGALGFVSRDAIGKPWPLCFGEVLHVPASRAFSSTDGRLKEKICIVDASLQGKLSMIAQAFQAEQLIQSYYAAVADGAEAIAPPAQQLINEYTAALSEFVLYASLVNLAINGIETGKRGLERAAGDDALKAAIQAQIDAWSIFLEDVGIAIQVVQFRLQAVEFQTELLKQEIAIQDEAFQKQVEAVNIMRGLYARYLALESEYCRQLRCQKTSFAVFNGDDFPQNVTVDIEIKGVRFRGVFDDDIFTQAVGPLPKYTNLTIADRQPILDECDRPIEQAGADVFWIEDATANLKGTYALVHSSHDEKNHVIQITQQEGTKCTFELKEWGSDKSSGGNSGRSGGGLIKSDIPIPSYVTPFGAIGPDPTFNGLLDPANDYSLCRNLDQDVLEQLAFFNNITVEQQRTLIELYCLKPKDEAENALLFLVPSPREVYTLIGEDISEIIEVSGVGLEHWFDGTIYYEEIPEDLYWEANPGTTVTQADVECEVHIANILPSEIRGVHAYRTIDEERLLTPVPTSYYNKNESLDLGPFVATTVTLHQPLSTYEEENWEDTIYVSLVSSVGPNVVDILQHIVETYTSRTVDAASFDDVRDKFKSGGEELYPANFCLLNRLNAATVLQEIAWQARCSLYEDGGVYYIKYLAEEPDSVVTLSDSDVLFNTFKITLTNTEDLVTKLIAKWREDYLPIEDGDEQPEVVLRHNVKKYGLLERDVDFYIYNIESLVEKSATFWLIRLSNTWKQATFSLDSNKVRIEALDCITLDFDEDLVASDPVKCLVTDVSYSPNEAVMQLSVWIPVRAGEMTQYPFAWSATAAETAEYPTLEEIGRGHAGGTGIGISLTEIPGC